MRVRMSIPSHEAKQMKEKLTGLVRQIEHEGWVEGDLELVRSVEIRAVKQ